MTPPIDNDRFRKLLISLPGKAIQYLYELYYHRLVTIAFNLTHDHDVSEDIVQETFVHVWENHKRLGQFQELPIHFYLIRVVKNKSITHYKKHKRFQDHFLKNPNQHPSNSQESSIENKIIEEEINRELRELINTFPKREKECLLMKIDQEMRPDQIAACLKVTRKAVERSLTAANKRLRKYWKKKADY